ncbi:MAG: hypothetical protein V3U27_07120 [Candidatus Tectomicrobia bacterium]
MQRGRLIVSIILLLSSPHLSQVLACESIEPFGDLRWEDTLVDAVIKLNDIGTVQYVSLQGMERGRLDMSGMHVRTAILTKVAAFLSAGQQPMVADTLLVSARPIFLFGLEFSLHIAYSPAVVPMRDHAGAMTGRTEANEMHDLPLRMMHVVVSKSHASLLETKTLRRLQAAMTEKYRTCVVFHADAEEMYARDKHGRAFLARWRAAEAFREVEPGYTGSGLLQYRNSYRQR